MIPPAIVMRVVPTFWSSENCAPPVSGRTLILTGFSGPIFTGMGPLAFGHRKDSWTLSTRNCVFETWSRIGVCPRVPKPGERSLPA